MARFLHYYSYNRGCWLTGLTEMRISVNLRTSMRHNSPDCFNGGGMVSWGLDTDNL